MKAKVKFNAEVKRVLEGEKLADIREHEWKRPKTHPPTQSERELAASKLKRAKEGFRKFWGVK